MKTIRLSTKLMAIWPMFLLHTIESFEREPVYLNKKITKTYNTVWNFETKNRISADECIKECKQRKTCRFVNYHMYVHVCSMQKAISNNTIPDVADSNGFVYTQKSDWNMTSYAERCADCSDSQTCQLDENPRCINTGCGIPPAVENTIILGNRYGVKSLLKYECTPEYEMNDGSISQITCQDNGYWTESNIQCTYLCSSGWELSYRKSCYLLVKNAQPWTYGKANCEELDAHLVDIGSQEEANFLNTTFYGFYAYIGLNDRSVEGQFRWSDNSILENSMLTNWRNGEPNDFKGEDCVKWDKGEWNDFRCNKNIWSICEYELSNNSN